MPYISDQIPLLTTAQRNTFALKKGATVIKSADDVLNYFLCTFEYWKTPSPIATAWAVYESMHHRDFEKALDAWLAEYDPLHNYDGKEKTILLKSEGKTTIIDDGESHTAPDSTRNKVTTQATEGAQTETTTENEVTTYDNQTPRLDNKSTVTSAPTGGEETIYNLKTDTETDNTNTRERTNVTITHDGKTYTAHDIEINELEKGGNLGLTTSEQLIIQEVEMRLKPLIKMYLDAFIKEYAYCVE